MIVSMNKFLGKIYFLVYSFIHFHYNLNKMSRKKRFEPILSHKVYAEIAREIA